MQLPLAFLAICLCSVLAYDFNYPTKPNVKVSCDGTEGKDFVRLGRKYYFVGQSKVTWFEAAHICRQFGGDLALIESAEEMHLISQFLEGVDKNGWFWTSGNDLVKVHQFASLSNGLPLPYTTWSAGQPDYPGTEQCVHLWHKEGAFKMNNWQCNSKAFYLCQRQNYTRCWDDCQRK